ncbi:MAG: acyl-CoA dehydrogenase [Deltaproteobacteria bacterium CG11_big_fil_rev_8_21_14_0_20_47_16]|nr:MAG: acyl-CoA dehydrogenase [Deltaproteobacteria bacterium CG11_big_fil_rev_8_21_14_0_20_47_16]
MAAQGGDFLLTPLNDDYIFIPDELDSTVRELADVTVQFMTKEVMPLLKDIEDKKPGVMSNLLKKTGELGLLMVEVPEKYSGMGMGKVTATAISENVTHDGSFAVAFMCHTGIATLPILYYGTEDQKQKYLPKLASGEFLGAYALTEPGSGSDALAAKTKAVLSPDGKHYILNGEKTFITNGGFADLYTVFAKVDGEKFTAFLVERTMPGVSTGPEEHKMGIHGSSTVPLILQDCKVPVENVLGEVGRGHKIAFNILNVGRWKLGAACVGSCKRLFEITTKYITERMQFGKPLSSFELIRNMVANSAIKTFMIESIVYRYAGMLDQISASLDHNADDFYSKMLKVIEEFAIEASIAKVYGSEALSLVSDDAVQMLGGYGFIEDYSVARFYRDNRVNRIFEGTNEINRMLISGTLLKRMVAGKIDFMTSLQTVLDQLKTGFPTTDSKKPWAAFQDQVERYKRLAIYFGGVAVNKYGPAIQEHEGVLAVLADCITAAYVADSSMRRLLKLRTNAGDPKCKIPADIVCTYLAERLPQLQAMVEQSLISIADGNKEEYLPYLKAMRRLCPQMSWDCQAAKGRIAEAIITKHSYAW